MRLHRPRSITCSLPLLDSTGGAAATCAFAAGAKLPPLEAALQPVLGAIAKMLPSYCADRQAVLLLLPADSRKPACRALGAGGGRLQPLELKLARAAPQLVCLSTAWAVDLRLALDECVELLAEHIDLSIKHH